MDEMMITNGIVYSVSQQKVYGLAELPSHGINNEIYHDFHQMRSDKPKSQDLSRMTYFDETSIKLNCHSATGLTQVRYLNIIPNSTQSLLLVYLWAFSYLWAFLLPSSASSFVISWVWKSGISRIGVTEVHDCRPLQIIYDFNTHPNSQYHNTIST